MLALGSPGCASDEKHACSGDGVICTYMGNGEAGLGEDGVSALEVSLYLPQDLTFGPDGQPYVADWNNHRIRTLAKDGKVETVIGTGYLGDAKDGPAREASLNHPTHVAFDDEGRMILSAWHNSKVMRYDPDTTLLETLCGTGMRDYGGDDGPANKAILDLPVATAFDREGRLLIMDQANQRVRRIDENDMITTVVGPNKSFEPAPDYLTRVCVPNPMTGARAVQVVHAGGRGQGSDDVRGAQAAGLRRRRRPGRRSADVSAVQPIGAARGPHGDGQGRHAVFLRHRQSPRFARSTRTATCARSPAAARTSSISNFKGGYAGDGGPAIKAKLSGPTDVAIGKNGALYIADTHNSCIRKVDTKGEISTVAGKCGNAASTATAARPKTHCSTSPTASRSTKATCTSPTRTTTGSAGRME